MGIASIKPFVGAYADGSTEYRERDYYLVSEGAARIL